MRPLCSGRRNDTFRNGIYQLISTCWNESLLALIKQTVCWKWQTRAFLSNVACTIAHVSFRCRSVTPSSLYHWRAIRAPSFKPYAYLRFNLEIIKFIYVHKVSMAFNRLPIIAYIAWCFVMQIKALCTI